MARTKKLTTTPVELIRHKHQSYALFFYSVKVVVGG